MAKYHRHDERNKRKNKQRLVIDDSDLLYVEEKKSKQEKYKKSISYDINDYYADAEEYEDF